MRWNPFRITELWAKIAYVLGAWFLVPIGLRLGLGLIAVPVPVIVAIDVVASFAAVWVGTRAFRVRGESVMPPRLWWRATGRPPAGFVLFALFALSTFILLSSPTPPDLWTSTIYAVPIAAFYLHSSIRLLRGDAVVPPRRDDAKYLARPTRF